MKVKHLLIALVVMASAMVLAVAIKPMVYHPALTLSAANLLNKQWSEEEYKQAAEIELRRQKVLYPKILDLIKRQDANRLLALADSVGQDLPSWNDQQNGLVKEKYRPCHLAQAQLLGMIAEGSAMNQSAYEANRDACDALVGWW